MEFGLDLNIMAIFNDSITCLLALEHQRMENEVASIIYGTGSNISFFNDYKTPVNAEYGYYEIPDGFYTNWDKDLREYIINTLGESYRPFHTFTGGRLLPCLINRVLSSLGYKDVSSLKEAFHILEEEESVRSRELKIIKIKRSQSIIASFTKGIFYNHPKKQAIVLNGELYDHNFTRHALKEALNMLMPDTNIVL